MRFSEAFSIKANQIDHCENKVVVECLKKRRKGIFRTIPLPKTFTDEFVELFVEPKAIWIPYFIGLKEHILGESNRL